MSASEAAKTLAAALVESEEQRRQRDQDVVAQLQSLERALRSERKLNDDRLETVMLRFDKLDAKLEAIAKILTTNGSGHA